MSKVSDLVVTQSMLDKALTQQSKSIIDDLNGVIDIFASRIYERFNKLEKRVDSLEEILAKLNNTIDGFIKRIDNYEQENVARDRQVARLETWIQQIAKETGVKLKNSP